jgi:hypothetical protein
LELLPEDPYALWGLAQLSTPAMRATLMKQAAEAARLEWTLLPPQLASRERERLRLLSQRLEEDLRATEP